MSIVLHQKIGLFFGSFNPVHIGHTIIARFMIEFTDIDEVWFIISPHNPLKEKKTLLADNHRFYMVNMAVENEYRIKASNIEFHMPQPSYTVHTLVYLEEKHPAKEFVVIAGADILPTFHRWKNYDRILEYYHLYIYPRPGNTSNPFEGHSHIHFVDAPLMDISASFIRKSIKHGKDVSFLLPPGVYDHIINMHFYQ